MADNDETMESYSDYALTAYSDCNIIALNMGMDLTSEDFGQLLADGFRYIALNEGPYLIHCKEGKDRTGFAAAILECLMGASLTEVVNDYMLTYYNFYGITEDTDQYMQIADSNIKASLAKAFGIEWAKDADVASQDLSGYAENYLKAIGMNDDEISLLRASLQ